MKKVICMITVLLLCLNLAVPAFAAEDGFVPSITYKPNPEIVPVVGEDGKEYPGVVLDDKGDVVGYLDTGCLKITPIAHLWDDEIQVEEPIENLLLFVYNGLNEGTMELPYEEHNAGLVAENMVVRDLFDARWTCEEHPKLLEPEGVVIELTFDLGVVADAEIYVQTYDEEKDEWEPIVKTINNGDGTVTCTFEHLCAITFAMPLTAAPAVVEKAPSVMPWIILLIIAAVAVVVIIMNKKKKSAV